MGESHQFRPLFSASAQSNQFMSDSQSTTASQESAIHSTVFPPASFKPIFGAPPQNASAGGTKNSAFGGLVFSASTENPFAAAAAAGRPSIFGGNSTSQSLNVPKSEEGASAPISNFFGSLQPVFSDPSGRSDLEGSSAGIFGGAAAISQNSNQKQNLFGSAVTNSEPASMTKQSLFGGSYSKNEESFKKSGFPVFSKGQASDVDGTLSNNIVLRSVPGEMTKVSFSGQSPVCSPEKHSLFPKPVFGGFVASGSTGSAVSSSSHQSTNMPDSDVSSQNFCEKEEDNSLPLKLKVDETESWELDYGEDENRSNLVKERQRSTKIIRKRGVFSKPVEDMKLSSRNQSSEETRSIVCYPLRGDLPDASVLKDYFSQFGYSRVVVNKEKRYAIATYKIHDDAVRAIKGGSEIGGVKCRLFWRNMAKPRRRSSEESEKAIRADEKLKIPRRVQAEVDPSVREELEAISGIDYLIPENTSSKRKSALNFETHKRAHPSSEGHTENDESKTDGQEKRKRANSYISKTEGSKTSKVSAGKGTKTGGKSPLHSKRIGAERISAKKSNDLDELKTAKAENSSVGGAIGPSAVTSELLEILKQQALSSEEKLRVLEARDKLLRLRKVKQYDISKAVKTVGTCPDMCPEKERLLRENRRQVSQYEMKANGMDASLMVKQYSRSSADQEEPLPHELRPPAVLTSTMNYLMHCIMNLGDQPGENLGDWYLFLWDRLRGIRKEITQQELNDIDAVRLVEQCARFHIHCGARLVAEDISVFDDRINTENLTKCLQTLKHMYHDLWMNNSITCLNEPEFVTYFLLLNLNNGTIMWEMEQLREEVLESPEIGFVAAMYNSLSSNNFVRFFRLVRKASYLNSCLCIRYFYQVRAKALATLVKALAKTRPVQYPLLTLIEDLAFENAEHAATFCAHHGLMVENVTSETACVVLSQDTFSNPSFVLPSERALRLVESKKTGSVGEVVNGGPLPPRTFERHAVHHSFDANGYLLKNAYYAKDQGATGLEIKDIDGDLCSEETSQVQNEQTQVKVPVNVSNCNEGTLYEEETVSIPTSISFGGPGNQKLPLSSGFPSLLPGSLAPFGSSSNQILKSAFTSTNSTHPSLERQETLKSDQVPGQLEPLRGLLYRNVFMDQNVAKIEAQKAQEELEAIIQEGTEAQFQELLQSGVQEATAEVAILEMKAAEEELRAQEKAVAEQQLRVQEELRKRALEAHVDKISNVSLLDLVSEVVSQLIVDLAQEVHVAEEQLVSDINNDSENVLTSLVYIVTKEYCSVIASEELRTSQEVARHEAVQKKVTQVFYHWLHRARQSLHRKRVMEDFPAGVIPLSVKEHAERWGFSTNLQEVLAKHNEKAPDIPELKMTPAYPQITLAELIGAQVVNRYDAIRTKMGLQPTDKLLYKLFVSVPDELLDPAVQLVDWWIRRTFKPSFGILHDDVGMGVFRVVSGVKITSEVAVYASLQLVRGNNPLEKQIGLSSGTSSVLFTVSPRSNIVASRSRLTNLLESVCKLPAMPLVVAVICSSEPPLDGLKQLVVELDLDKWVSQRIISDYQILHVEELFDLKYLSERFNMALNYMVMMWTPCPEFSLVCLKNVLRSTFQMFYISIQFNYNSSEVYPQDIDDPRVLIGLCNEWLDRMCQEFVASYHEARDLCGEEFWPLLHNGAYIPFLNKPEYVHFLKEVMKSVCLPAMKWPPTSEKELETIMTQYCSWLRPEEWKQTQRRLSCLNDLSWAEKMKSLPWVNLIEDWIEARIKYIDTSVICGHELLCLMRTQNVEYLYTYPWWAQSKYITLYLETHGSGRENDMDVDQTTSSMSPENDSGGDCSPTNTAKNTFDSGLCQLEEVTNCISELKGVNESFLTRLRSAVEDGATDICTNTNYSEIESPKKKLNNVATDLQGFKSLVNTIDQQIQSQRAARDHISHILSSALSEGPADPLSVRKDAINSCADNIPKNSTSLETSSNHGEGEGAPAGDCVKSSGTMTEIMAAVNDIVASLNQKYKILESESNYVKITDLKMGLGKIDAYSTLLSSDKLHPSPFIEQSQRRMQKRLLGPALQKNISGHEVSQTADEDSDLEVLSEVESGSTVIRTVSSPSVASESNSESDADVGQYDEGDFSDGKVYHDSDDSDGDKRRPRKTRVRCDTGDRHLRKRRPLRDDSSLSESYQSGQESECGSSDGDEVQTISSEESRAGTPNHDLNSKSPRSQNNHHFDVEEGNSSHLNSLGFSVESISQNDLVPHEEDAEGHLLVLDDGGNHYAYYNASTDVQGLMYSETAGANDLNEDGISEIIVSNQDVGSDLNLASYSLIPEHTIEGQLENVHELEIERGSNDLENQPESNDHIMPDDYVRVNHPPKAVDHEDNNCATEAYEELEEEEYDEGEEDEEDCDDEDDEDHYSEEEQYEKGDQGNSGEDVQKDYEEEEIEEQESEALEEEEEEELESEGESEPDEDSDVCEVIDD